MDQRSCRIQQIGTCFSVMVPRKRKAMVEDVLEQARDELGCIWRNGHPLIKEDIPLTSVAIFYSAVGFSIGSAIGRVTGSAVLGSVGVGHGV